MTHQTQLKPAPPINTFPPDAPEWLYQEIMRHIEPDLLLERLPRLDAQYAGETLDQRVERMQYYERAFALFDQISADISAMIARDARRLKDEARGEIRRREGQEHGQELKRIEDIIASRIATDA